MYQLKILINNCELIETYSTERLLNRRIEELYAQQKKDLYNSYVPEIVKLRNQIEYGSRAKKKVRQKELEELQKERDWTLKFFGVPVRNVKIEIQKL